MPANAIATGLVDLVLPLDVMSARITAYDERLRDADRALSVDDVDDPGALRDILTLLKVRTSHDFSNYKTATLLRRIHRRMTVANVVTLTDYARLIRERPDEAITLMRDLLISVTHFFRDGPVFAALEQGLIPRLFDHKTPNDAVRVWVPACATGEEAYSLAILLAEYSREPDRPAVGADFRDRPRRTRDRHGPRRLLQGDRNCRCSRTRGSIDIFTASRPAIVSGANCAS